MDELVLKNAKAGRLRFTTDLASVLNEQEIVFSAVGTPPDEDGSADLNYVLQVAKTIGENLDKYMVVVTKSTVPVGTAKKSGPLSRRSLTSVACKLTSTWPAIPSF